MCTIVFSHHNDKVNNKLTQCFSFWNRYVLSIRFIFIIFNCDCSLLLALQKVLKIVTSWTYVKISVISCTCTLSFFVHVMQFRYLAELVCLSDFLGCKRASCSIIFSPHHCILIDSSLLFTYVTFFWVKQKKTMWSLSCFWTTGMDFCHLMPLFSSISCLYLFLSICCKQSTWNENLDCTSVIDLNLPSKKTHKFLLLGSFFRMFILQSTSYFIVVLL